MDMLDKNYWNSRWQNKETGWDIGNASTPLTAYTDQLINKKSSILIPGCGNAYEAEHLLSKGFSNITLLDISPIPVDELTKRLSLNIGKGLQIICDDFFKHQATYDLILEQTFFCALHPSLREAYVKHMHQLLKPEGKLAGVLFNKTFTEGPPFGGNADEYQLLFSPYFTIEKMEACYNSIQPRLGSELFVVMKKK
jgi:methyl halide transferase